MNSYLSFTLQLIVLTFALAGITLLLQNIADPHWIHEKTIWVVLFYFVLTWFTGLLALYLLKISKENSVMILLGVGVLRITGSLAFVFLILWMGIENILWFVVNFFVIYLLYLLFDIYTFITNLRPRSE
ncbi:MAG TPA: hypothetical protein VKX33_04200 [Cyclobacteriaceae bacterium]|nr:hypothetical protein [Cyclobacteriaceae bacterium]